ncbi:MAG: preprotein translocase subunit SecG [Bacteroidia bacterium]|nr:preprotein translocase subunit SecG [Bacteroidia bacterium]
MILSILIILVCILLVLVILIQNSKGGGIQSQFGAATQIMGVKRGTEVVEKATWALAIVLIVLSVFMAPKIGVTNSGSEDSSSVAKKKAQTAVNVQPAPSAPAAPAGQAAPQPK